MEQERIQVAIIGGGAAGFFAAINLALRKPNYQICIYEKSSKLLSKVRISGGGRCNVTHACNQVPALLKHYPRGFDKLKPVFKQFNATDTVTWFAERGITLHTEADGRMFPSTNDSATIVNALQQEAQRLGVKILLHHDLTNLTLHHPLYTLSFANQADAIAHKVIVACGGLTKKEHYSFLHHLPHTLENPIPSLFSFNLQEKDITQLAGLSVQQAKVKVAGAKLESQGPLLITHWGVSGPAILKLSAWGARILNELHYRFILLVSWNAAYGESDWHTFLEEQFKLHPKKQLLNTSMPGIPKRLWEYICWRCDIPENFVWNQLSNKLRNVLINNLTCMEFPVTGKTTYKDEFVTCGGIALDDIDLTRMESKKYPGLFFAGEVINVDGVTGGFNFQNAWSTAYVCALNC